MAALAANFTVNHTSFVTLSCTFSSGAGALSWLCCCRGSVVNLQLSHLSELGGELGYGFSEVLVRLGLGAHLGERALTLTQTLSV